MPRVPTYDQFQAQPNALPAVGLRTPEVEPTAAQGLQELGVGALRGGHAMAGIALDAQNQANQTRVNDAMNRAVAARLTLTHDKDQGFANLKGDNALTRPDGKTLDAEYGEKYDSQVTAIRDGLGNDAQRKAFDLQAGRIKTEFMGNVQQHMAGEFKTYRLSTQTGAIKVAQDQIGLDWDKPDSVAQGVNAIKAATAESGRLQGWSPQETLAKTVEMLSPAHASVVSSALQANKPDYAREYMKNVNAELTPEARVRLNEALKISDVRVKAQTFGDEVVAKGLGLPEALALAREKFQGQDEDEAIREVKTRFTEVEGIRQRDAQVVGRAAWTAVMETGKVPATVLADLRAKAPEEERQIRDWLDQKERQGDSNKTDIDVYYGLRRMATEAPAEFAKLDLRKSEPWLSKPDLKHLAEIQGRISTNDAKMMESQRVLKTTMGAIKAEVAAIGIDLTPKEGTAKAKETARFMGALTRALDDATAAKGSPLTGDESKRIGMTMVREGIEQGSGIFGMFANRKRGYEIATDPGVNPGASFVLQRFNGIPPSVRTQLEVDLRNERGLGTRPLNDGEKSEIERAYTRGVQQGRFN